MIPTFYAYSTGDGYAIFKGSSLHLGNLGFSEPWCASMRFDNSYKVECGAGKISELKFIGIKPETLPKKSPWEEDFCGRHEDYNDINHCTLNHLQVDNAKFEWDKVCKGKKTC